MSQSHNSSACPNLGALVGASREMSLEPDPIRALEILVGALRDDLGVDRVGIFTYEPQERLLSRAFGIDPRGIPETGPEVHPVTDQRAPLMDVARRQIPFFFSNNATAEYPPGAFEPAVNSLAVIPIVAGEELLGVLCADNILSGRLFREEILEPLFLYAGLAALPLFALYQRREAERTEAMRTYIHREVLSAVTNGKMQLCSPAQIAAAWPEGTDRIPIERDADVRKVRQAVLSAGERAGMSPDRAADLGLCASEAATNALLHGSGGYACVMEQEGMLCVLVSDQGTGIAPEHLPRATLQKGWSTRESMGLGFTVIKETADSVLLSTSPQGTQVIIKMLIEAEANDPEEALLWGGALSL